MRRTLFNLATILSLVACLFVTNRWVRGDLSIVHVGTLGLKMNEQHKWLGFSLTEVCVYSGP